MSTTKKRYLTKSRFKLAYECPTKLYYEGHSEYKNLKKEDAFLEALAEGGFQVGALAQVMHPGGIEIEERNPDAAAEATAPYLNYENFLLFEPALKHESFLVRADILEKRGDTIFLKEVKAKSWEAGDTFFLRRGGPGIRSDWLPYLLDIAFQTHVASLVFPKLKIVPKLVLANKDATTSVEGLHQKFRIERIGNQRKIIIPPGLSPKDIGDPILCEVDATEAVEFLMNTGVEGITVPELAKRYAEVLSQSEPAMPIFKRECRDCEYRVSPAELSVGEKSGFSECMKTALKGQYKDGDHLALDLWNDRKMRDRIDEGKRFLADIDPLDLSPDEPEAGPLVPAQRQYLQVKLYREGSTTPWIDRDGLANEINSWTYPYNFIDFETCMVAIPFHKGHHPYQQIAFQFSHHILEKDGSIRHENEFLMPDRGRFPNYDFLRALKAALSGNQGSIFRYSNHENTVLNQLRDQLVLDRADVKDADELIQFIESITSRTEGRERVHGPRTMIDLWDLYKKYHYIPSTKGSNSLKYVLPAILNESQFLKDKYSKPIYGAGIPSKNYKDQAWVHLAEGKVLDPYKLLEPMIDGIPQEEIERFADDEGIRNGGAAMMAWAKIQFMETSAAEEAKIRKELLQYCELDTLAMVMLVEHWKELLGDLK